MSLQGHLQGRCRGDAGETRVRRRAGTSWGQPIPPSRNAILGHATLRLVHIQPSFRLSRSALVLVQPSFRFLVQLSFSFSLVQLLLVLVQRPLVHSRSRSDASRSALVLVQLSFRSLVQLSFSFSIPLFSDWAGLGWAGAAAGLGSGRLMLGFGLRWACDFGCSCSLAGLG